MNFRAPQWIQIIFAMIFVPPFALVSGGIIAVLVWFLLADAGLPSWARLAISILVIPGLPGLWFVAMPILFWHNRVPPVALSEETQAWQNAQFETMEQHQDAFTALRRQRIEQVVPGGMSVTADGLEMTIVATELGAIGGVITVVQHPLGETRPEPPEPGQIPEAMPFIGAITRLTDDVGTDYIVLAQVSEPVADGGRARIDFIPAPPPNARELQLSMSQLYVRERLVLPGPWDLKIPLSG